MSLWMADAAKQAMAATLIGEARAISGISIDTRTLAPGDLFFAIQGEVRDGHEFVAAALQKGAAGAVVLRARMDEFSGQGTLYGVDDVLGQIQHVARHFDIRNILEIGFLSAHLVRVTQNLPEQSAAARLKHHHAFTAIENNATDADHVALAHGIADHGKGFLSHTVIGR